MKEMAYLSQHDMKGLFLQFVMELIEYDLTSLFLKSNFWVLKIFVLSVSALN